MSATPRAAPEVAPFAPLCAARARRCLTAMGTSDVGSPSAGTDTLDRTSQTKIMAEFRESITVAVPYLRVERDFGPNDLH